MGKIIGIDFGTTNSCVAVVEGKDTILIIPNNEGRRVTPSVVAFLGNGERKIGAAAKRQAITNSQNTISSVKRLMGLRYQELEEKERRIPYKITRGENDVIKIDVLGRLYSPQEIAAMILEKLKRMAEDYLGTTVTEAVITVPAYFNDSQRQATKEAGEIAGLKIKRIINEPTAIALAYGLDKSTKRDQTIAIFRMGGGTFDISILELFDGVFEVKAITGDTSLGGEDFDQVIVTYLSDSFSKKEGIDLREDPMALQRLKEAAEKVKIDLSSSSESEVNLPYIAAIGGIPKHLVQKITRSQFERLIDPFINRTIEACRKALDESGLKKTDIDHIILGGGSTRIPRIQGAIQDFFEKKPYWGGHPGEASAKGAAIQGGVISGEIQDVLLLDVTPLSLGIETMGGLFDVIIEANSTIPNKKSKVYSTAADNQPSVEVHILQGERPMAKDNRTIGRFILNGIPPAPRGVPQIEVIYSIDANGILTVSAKDKASGVKQSVNIESSTGLSLEEISRMKQEAEKMADADQKIKENADRRNAADQLVLQTEKQLKEFGASIPSKNRKKINTALSSLRNILKTNDLDRVDSKVEDLNLAWSEASQLIYNRVVEKDKEKHEKPDDVPPSRNENRQKKNKKPDLSKQSSPDAGEKEKSPAQSFQIFIAYSRQDAQMLNRLRVHLRVLEKTHKLKIWYDGLIEAGDDWDQAIHKAMMDSNIILLLISADFIASDYAYDKEMMTALRLHEEGKSKVIPLIIKECTWEITPFAKLQVLPSDGIPVSHWNTPDKPFKEVVQTIINIILN